MPDSESLEEDSKRNFLFRINMQNMALITVLVLLAIMLFSGFAFRREFENPEIYFNEEPLEKNTKLQIYPGERYVYSYPLNDTEINITYSLLEGDGCTIILLPESVNRTNICIDEWGLDSSGSNSAFEKPQFFLFKPWMLALHPTWKWNNSMHMRYNNITHRISDNYYRVMRTEDYNGRAAYVVEIESSVGAVQYQWIDVEKRIVLKIIGEEYMIELAEGLE